METTALHYTTVWSICVLHASVATNYVRCAMSVSYIILSSWLSVPKII